MKGGITTLIIVILIDMILRLIVPFRSLNLSLLFPMKSLSVHGCPSSLHDFSGLRCECLVHDHLTDSYRVSTLIIWGPASS